MKIVEAEAEHLPALVSLLNDDFLGKTRESVSTEDLSKYQRAFSLISDDPNNVLYVALDADENPVGTFQLTFLPGLAFAGGTRAQIESVRTRSDMRGKGIGRAMMLFAEEEARNKGCVLIQLATNKARPDAHRFYQSLGFEASHIGFKMML